MPQVVPTKVIIPREGADGANALRNFRHGRFPTAAPHADENLTVILETRVTGLLSSIRYSGAMNKPLIFSVLAVFTLLTGNASAQTIVQITRSDCDHLVAHVPASDEAYAPGVDVNGNAVASADLNAQPRVVMPDVISIPVTVDLATNLGIATPFLARPTVGEVQVTSDGRVTFNGQPVGGDAQQELAKRCQTLGAAN